MQLELLVSIPVSRDHHPNTRSDTYNAGGPRNPSSSRPELLGQDEQRQERDPEEGHYADHQQGRHENPATADAIGSVEKALAHATQYPVPSPLEPQKPQEHTKRKTDSLIRCGLSCKSRSQTSSGSHDCEAAQGVGEQLRSAGAEEFSFIAACGIRQASAT